MSAPVVIYASKTGFTGRYAGWIAESLHCPALPLAGLRAEALKSYRLVIYGGGVYSGNIAGLKDIKRLLAQNPRMPWVAFAVGVTQSSESVLQSLQKQNFPAGESRPSHFFYFPGGINFEQMSLWDKLLMGIFLHYATKNSANSQGNPALPARLTSVDLTDRASIRPLFDYVVKKWG